MEEAKAELESTRLSIIKYHQDEATARKMCNVMKAEYIEIKGRCAIARRELIENMKKNEIAYKDYKKFIEENGALSTQILGRKEELEELNGKLDHEKSEYNKSQLDLESALSTLDDFNKNNQAEFNKLTKEQEEKLNILKQKYDSGKENLETINKEIISASAKSEEAEKLEDKLNALAKEKTILEESIDELKKKREEAKDKLKTETEAYERMQKATQHEAQSDKKDYKAVVEKLRDDLNDLSKDYKSIKQEMKTDYAPVLKRLEEEIKDRAKEYLDLRLKCNMEKTKISKYTEELKEVKGNCKLYQQEVKVLQAKINRLNIKRGGSIHNGSFPTKA